PGEQWLPWLPDDLVRAYVQLQLAYFIAPGRRAGGGHGIASVIDGIRRQDSMGQPEKQRRDMDLVRNQADRKSGRLENPPENVIVAVQRTRATVTEIRKNARTGLHRLAQRGERGIGRPEADDDAVRGRQRDRFQ